MPYLFKGKLPCKKALVKSRLTNDAFELIKKRIQNMNRNLFLTVGVCTHRKKVTNVFGWWRRQPLKQSIMVSYTPHCL